MKKFGIAAWAFISTCFVFCKEQNHNQAVVQRVNLPIDTFKLKYQANIHGKIKKVDETIYVGTETKLIKVNNLEFRKFVFGKSIKGIALVRNEDEKLMYINTKDFEGKQLNGQKPMEGLLYFNKKINEKWKVNIDSSFFWRREIEFVGIETLQGEKVLVYNVEAQEGYSDSGDQLSKLYYNRNRGFLKFVIKTHWFPVEVYRQ